MKKLVGEFFLLIEKTFFAKQYEKSGANLISSTGVNEEIGKIADSVKAKICEKKGRKKIIVREKKLFI